MDLSSYSISGFTGALASKAPVPGGGGAAALVGSLSASLCEMAGSLTLGKKKYADREDALRRLNAQAEELRLRFLSLIEEDAAAFEPLSKAYALPKTEPGYAETMRRVTLGACRAPLEMMRSCEAAASLLAEMSANCSPLMLSDVGCGAVLLKASLDAAALNVFVNTRLLPEDPEASAMQEEAVELQRAVGVQAQEIANLVRAGLLEGKHG